MEALRERNAVAARALEFTILTAARTVETLGATWSEVNLATKTWIIPKERMGGGTEHKVPLSDRAVEIVNEMAAIEFSDFVFAGCVFIRRPDRGIGVFGNLNQVKLCRGGVRATR